MAAIMHLAKSARRNGVYVLQIGEGADEAFGGYAASHRLWRGFDRLSLFSGMLRTKGAMAFADTLSEALGRISPGLPFSRLSYGVSDLLLRYARDEQVYWGHGTVFSSFQRKRLVQAKASYLDPYDSLVRRLAWDDRFGDRPFLDQLALIDMLVQLPERLLMRADRATMRYSVEARVPFLDREVLSVAFRVPPRLRANTPKSFLRGYARKKLPAAIVDRPKVGFPTAREVFLGRDSMARIRERVLAKPFLELTGFAPKSVDELVAAQGRGSGIEALWTLYVLALWVHHWT
jgi:asparagine synthase (glutamine-hydrolysing)